MAIRFTSGASMTTTRKISQRDKSPAVQSNSMKGMPGRINSGQDASKAGLTGGGGMGPKREGPVGQKGAAHRANQQNGRGSTDKSYRAASTGPAGKITGSGKMESLRGKALTSYERGSR